MSKHPAIAGHDKHIYIGGTGECRTADFARAPRNIFSEWLFQPCPRRQRQDSTRRCRPAGFRDKRFRPSGIGEAQDQLTDIDCGPAGMQIHMTVRQL
tara:strand:+ start:1887 stop:2177 length:291 start_codon:yes stop_codon:yes gene_type:complete